jgi:hypothetical protein
MVSCLVAGTDEAGGGGITSGAIFCERIFLRYALTVSGDLKSTVGLGV